MHTDIIIGISGLIIALISWYFFLKFWSKFLETRREYKEVKKMLDSDSMDPNEALENELIKDKNYKIIKK